MMMGIVVVSVAMVMVGMATVSMGTTMVIVMKVMASTMVVGMRDVMVVMMMVMVVAIETIVAMTYILLVADGQFLTLITGELDVFAYLWSNLAFVASLAQQRVNGLDAVPALLRSHFRQICSSFLTPLLIVELNTDTMAPNLPIQVVLSLLKAGEY